MREDSCSAVPMCATCPSKGGIALPPSRSLASFLTVPSFDKLLKAAHIMPARRNCHTKFARWPNGDILVAGNVTSEADFRAILDHVGNPGLARTANGKHPMLFEVQPANIPGTLTF